MGNQHPSTYEDKLRFLARNTKFGDGYFWIHPECINYKIIHTSIDRELLEAKMNILPDIFPSGVAEYRKSDADDCYQNSKTLYRLASIVHPIFTEYAKKTKHEIFRELDIPDFGLWYLDDGCLLRRKEYKDRIYFRYLICIGDVCETPILESLFKRRLRKIFGNGFGNININNSRATQRNKTWYIPKPVAELILAEAFKYGVLARKFPYGEGSTTIPLGVGNQG
jgi:hypothetical protein